MQDFQLYQQILGLTEPWRVDQVTLKVAAREVEVRVGYADTLWGCPECQQRMQVHDSEERRWRHLDSCQFQTCIVARVPVVRCAVHGTQTVAVPWAERYARFTRLFERLAIDAMLECSITGACTIPGVSWDEADGIKQRAVRRGLARKEPAVMARLCVDEKGMGRGQQYLTIVAQVTTDQTTVEYVEEGRSQARLDPFWEGLTPGQLAGVAAVAMTCGSRIWARPWRTCPAPRTKLCMIPFPW
jgi:transposase